LCDNEEYKGDVRRVRRRKMQVDDGASVDVELLLPPRDRFRVQTFIVIIDKLHNALLHRSNAYDEVDKRFGLLSRYRSMSAQSVDDNVRLLCSVYAADLDEDHDQIANEFKHFFHFIEDNALAQVPGVDGEGDQKVKVGSLEGMYKLLKVSGVETSFSNVEVIMRIYLSLFVTNCSGERSFSRLKRIKNVKNELRATMLQERLAALSLMCIEHDVVQCLNFTDIIETFAIQKARSVTIL